MDKTDALTIFLGLGFALTGLFAFFYPSRFFSLLPEYYGDFNLHFTKDAGIAFFTSGFLLLFSLVLTKWKAALTLSGALFVVLHGFFHIQMLFMGMAETWFDVAIELVVIIAPAAMVALLVVLRIKKSSGNQTA